MPTFDAEAYQRHANMQRLARKIQLGGIAAGGLLLAGAGGYTLYNHFRGEDPNQEETAKAASIHPALAPAALQGLQHGPHPIEHFRAFMGKATRVLDAAKPPAPPPGSISARLAELDARMAPHEAARLQKVREDAQALYARVHAKQASLPYFQYA